jgi:hypothetical protein
MVEHPGLESRSNQMIFDDSMWMPSSVANIEETESGRFEATTIGERQTQQDQVGTLAFLGLEGSEVEGLEREFQKDLTVSLEEKMNDIKAEPKYIQNVSTLQGSLNWLNIMPWDHEQPNGG